MFSFLCYICVCESCVSRANLLATFEYCTGKFWEHIQNHEFRNYPGLLLLLLFFRLILLDTSGCERGFSAMNRIKDKAATHIGDEVLCDLMTIHELGPAIFKDGAAAWGRIDIIPHNAIVHWRKQCTRSLGSFLAA